MPATLTTEKLLEMLPPFVAASKDVQATVAALSNELDRINEAKDAVRRQATPQTADSLLSGWESVLGIPVAPAGQTIEQRRETVVGYMQRLKSIATGPEWVAALTRLIGTQWTYEEYVPPTQRISNLVPNPSFEVNTTGWNVANSAGVVAGTFARQSGWANSGGFALRVSGTNAADTTARRIGVATASGTSGFPVQANKPYAAKVEINLNSGIAGVGGNGLRVFLNWYQLSGAASAFGGTFGTFQAASTPGLFTLTVAGLAPPDAAFAGIVVDATVNTVSDFVDYYVDSAIFTQGTLPVTYFDGDSTGYEWSGTAHQSASRKVSTVPANTIRVTLPFAAALAAPAGPSATPATTGGTLAAGTWHYKLTTYNSFGETTATADFTGVTTGSTGKNTLAWTAVAGAAGYRIYRGTSSSNHTLIDDVTTNGYVDVGGQAPSSVTPPLTNTTQGFAPEQARNLARDITPAHIDLQFVYASGFILGVSKLGNEVL
ncbi:MAG: putative phage tail protein [Baekduia sp.]